MTQQVALREGLRRGSGGRVGRGGRANIEEGPPVEEPPWSALAAGQVVWIGYAVVQLGVEDVFHERIAVVPVKVGYVSRPDLAVAEPVRGHRELDRNKGLVAPLVEPAALLEDVVHQALPHSRWQKLVQDYPLIVPSDQPLCLVEGLIGIRDAFIQHPID